MAESWLLHTVVFDLDDTLYLERDYVLSGFSAVDGWLQQNLGVTGFFDKAEDLFEKGVRGKIFDVVIRELIASPDDGLVPQLVEVYRSHQPAIFLPKESEEVLNWCAGKFNLGLITDGYRKTQENKIAALGLEKRIPCRIITDVLGRSFWKPHPEAYRRIMARFGGKAEGYVYVADNPIKDFIGPKQLGWRTVRIRRKGGEHINYNASPAEAAESEVETLQQLQALFTPTKHSA